MCKLHLKHATHPGHNKAYLRTVDTCVIILAISHMHHLRYGSSGWHAEKFQSMWYVISEQLGAQCIQDLLLSHAYIGCHLPSSMFSFIKEWMKCVECCPFTTPLSPWPNTQPALSPIPWIWHAGTPNYADVGPNLRQNLCQWSQKMAFHPWPEVFGLNTTNTACFDPACKMYTDGHKED